MKLWIDNRVSVAGGDSVFSADGVSVWGSAHSGCPVHQSPRTSTGSLPAGADARCRDLRIEIPYHLFVFQDNFQRDEDYDEVFALQKVERSRPQTPEDLMGVLEGVRALEALVQAAEESHRQFHFG